MLSGMQKGLSGMSQLGFVYAMFFFFLLLGFVITSTGGLASSTMAIIAPIVVTVAGPDGSVGLMAAVTMAFVLATGIVNMFSPAQAIVMASCTSSHVSYVDAIKPVGMFAGFTTLFSLLFIIPSTLLLLN